MNEEITASAVYDFETWAPVYKWQSRKGTLLLLVIWAVVTGLIVLSTVVINSEAGQINWATILPAPLFLGALVLFKIVSGEAMFKKSIARSPGHGQPVIWNINKEGISMQTPVSSSFSAWTLIKNSVLMPEGVAVFPSAKIFWWLPKIAFASPGEYDRFLCLVTTKTKHSFIG